MTDEIEQIDIETRKKRLVYRSNYRGFREADMILGGYVKANVDAMTDSDVIEFEQLMAEKDHDIYGWIMETLPVPKKFNTELMKRLRAFEPVVK